MNRSKRISFLAAAGVTVLALGFFLGRSRSSRLATSDSQPGTRDSRLGTRRPLYWYDPMKPEVHFDHPGKSPFMDMDLVAKYADEEAAPAGAVAGYAPVTIPRERMQEFGVATEPAAVRPLAGKVTTNGTVAEDESLRFDVNVKFAGWIRKLRVERTGDRVRRGETLFTVYSPELVATERELLLALENERRLGKSGDPEAARDAARLTAASRDRLRLWDVPDADVDRIARTGEIRTELPIASPATGTVIVKNAVEGMSFAPGTTLYTIADLSRVWILADVYAPEVSAVRRGDAADISLSSIPGRRLEGRVDFLYPTVNAETRTARVRIVVNNPSGDIRPGMYATVAIHGRSPEVLAVPRAAVIETGKRSIAFVETSPGRFEPRELSVGERTPDLVEVRSGLRAGERVVTSANFLVDSESRIGAVGTAPEGSAGQPRRSLHESKPAPPPEEPR